MGYAPIETIQEETRQWEFIHDLPESMGGFKKKLWINWMDRF